MLKCFYADLHIHTCLSPCADLTMSPKRIVEQAMAKKLDIIAICDHNSAENVHATLRTVSDKKITVLCGMEVTSTEEVHLLALFDEVKRVLNLQEIVYANLTPGENKEDLFGEQIIANEFDEVKGYNKRLLIGATNLTLKELVNKVHEAKKRVLLILASPIIDNLNYFESHLKKIKYKMVFSEIQTLFDEMRDDKPYTDVGISKVELAIFDIDAS